MRMIQYRKLINELSSNKIKLSLYITVNDLPPNLKSELLKTITLEQTIINELRELETLSSQIDIIFKDNESAYNY